MNTDLFDFNAETIELDEQRLSQFWDHFFSTADDTDQIWSRRVFIDTVNAQVSGGLPQTSLFLSTKALKINLTGNLTRSVLATAFIVAGLWKFGCRDIPKTALMAVVGTLFVIERVEIKKSDEEVVANIPLQRKNGKFRSPRKWYAMLPQDIKDQMNYLGFCDLLERLELGGFARQRDGKYLIFEKGRNKFRINWQ